MAQAAPHPASKSHPDGNEQLIGSVLVSVRLGDPPFSYGAHHFSWMLLDLRWTFVIWPNTFRTSARVLTGKFSGLGIFDSHLSLETMQHGTV